MSTSQADIDSLLGQAESLAEEALRPDPPPVVPPLSPPASEKPPCESASPAIAPQAGSDSRPDDLHRILRLEVPVIVKLAECKMPLGRVVSFNTGAIIEFDKSVDAHLDLLINNKCIGLGQAVKVGENFGLRITQIGTLREKIEALGA